MCPRLEPQQHFPPKHARNSSHSDIATSTAAHHCGNLLWLDSGAHLSPRHTPNSSHSDIPALLGMPTLPASLPLRALPALPSCPAAPLPCTTLFPPAAAEWAKPSGSAAATRCPHGVWNNALRKLNSARERLYRGLDLWIPKHYVFLVFSSYLCAKCARDSSPA